jgi:hypothetical protein
MIRDVALSALAALLLLTLVEQRSRPPAAQRVRRGHGSARLPVPARKEPVLERLWRMLLGLGFAALERRARKGTAADE